ncbi:hypothetical protein HDU85_005903 [Gaertneriomyces sp. JEL0708]|nr:hypothetical protein HDU85_005903 [Gaertneriomyces sp. JEL0708]
MVDKESLLDYYNVHDKSILEYTVIKYVQSVVSYILASKMIEYTVNIRDAPYCYNADTAEYIYDVMKLVLDSNKGNLEYVLIMMKYETVDSDTYHLVVSIHAKGCKGYNVHSDGNQRMFECSVSIVKYDTTTDRANDMSIWEHCIISCLYILYPDKDEELYSNGIDRYTIHEYYDNIRVNTRNADSSYIKRMKVALKSRASRLGSKYHYVITKI